MPELKSRVELVTPALAREWLKLNTRNRPIRQAAVADLAKAIERGEWKVTHQGIGFDENGILVDGQHRLEAIVKANRPVEIMVTWGVPAEAFTVMDTGRKRNMGDVLALNNEANATHLAAALRGLYLYQLNPDASWSGHASVVSHDQLLLTLEKNPKLRDSIPHGMALARSIKITTTAGSLGHYLTSTIRPDVDQQPWLTGLITGANLSEGDPRLTLRNTMLNLASGKTHRRREDSREHLLYYLKAWNAWLEGRKIKLLRRSPGEKIPTVSRYGLRK